MSIVVPAVLPSSRKDLTEKLQFFTTNPSIDRVQIDIVDGRFASPASWPYTAPEELATMVAHRETLPLLEHIEYEIDLICFDADIAAEHWLSLGATRLTFHAEATTNIPHLLLSARRRYGDSGVISFGLALNISSDLALIEQCIEQIQYVQFMGISRIGRQGQPFDSRVFEKVRVFHSRHPDIPMQVDGGISFENAEKLFALKVQRLVIGSRILKAENPSAAIAAFEAIPSPFGV